MNARDSDEELDAEELLELVDAVEPQQDEEHAIPRVPISTKSA